MSAFDHLVAKHGMVAAMSAVEETSTRDQEQAYIRLCELLHRFQAVVMVVRYGDGKYSIGGFGLHFTPNWKDAESQQEIHDLFWGSAFALFMERHGGCLPVYRQPSDSILPEIWGKEAS